MQTAATHLQAGGCVRVRVCARACVSCVLSGGEHLWLLSGAIPLSFALMPTLTVLKAAGISSLISENGHQTNKTKVLRVGRALSFQALAILASFLLYALWFYHSTTLKALFFLSGSSQ